MSLDHNQARAVMESIDGYEEPMSAADKVVVRASLAISVVLLCVLTWAR